MIYFQDYQEAFEIAERLDEVLHKNIGDGLTIIVKRGCSEFAQAFPRYKEVKKDGDHPFKYNENWRDIEALHDAKNVNLKREQHPSLSGITLSDFLVIQNWLKYAIQINDDSANIEGFYTRQ